MSTEIEVRNKTGDDLPLPLGLIESEILPKLPARSVGVCRCVCKNWKSFLSSPTFGRMHLSYHHGTINDYKLLVIDGVTFHKLPLSVTVPSNPNFSSSKDVVVVALASLDGLVVLGSGKHLLLWNPLTGAYRKLSVPVPGDFSYYDYRDVWGFYKDYSSNDYKLVYLVKGGNCGAYVYSHRLDTWREIDFCFQFDDAEDAFCNWSPATFWGQCLYFTVTAYTLMPVEKYSWIICFDVRTETFSKIRFPPVPDGRGFCGSLVILNGSLHLCVTYYDIGCLEHGDLWRMDGDDDDDHGWVKVAAFSDSAFTIRRPPHICTVAAGNWLVVLDEENNSFEKVNVEDFMTRYPYFYSASRLRHRNSLMIYVETLVSPNP